jgi:hypothetical protein
MKKVAWQIALGIGLAMVSATTASAALNYDRVNYFKPGKHQIYVWCTGGTPDTSVTVEAPNAEEAIKKAVAGKPNCWGVWQGLNT